MPVITRRSALQLALPRLAAGAARVGGRRGAAQLPRAAARGCRGRETHGLSSFGELALPADFKYFRLRQSGRAERRPLVLQIKQTSGNQNFDTFDTLNIYILKGDGAAGMAATFDTLMSGTATSPTRSTASSRESVRISADKLTYRFLLRPEARFHDGSQLTARDVAFSLNDPEGRRAIRPTASPCDQMASRGGRGRRHRRWCAVTPKRSRDLHLVVAGLPIFSQAYWTGARLRGRRRSSRRSAPAPTRSARFEQGRFIEFERVADYWAKDLPVNVGHEQFRPHPLRVFPRPAGRLRGVQGRRDHLQRGIHRRASGRQGYDFPAVRDGRVKKEDAAQRRAARHRRAGISTPAATIQGSAHPRGDRARLRLRVDEQEHHVSPTSGSTSYFQNSADEGGRASPCRRNWRCWSRSAARCPTRSSASPMCRRCPTARAATAPCCGRPTSCCARPAASATAPCSSCRTASPSTIEFLDSSPALQPHTEPFQAESEPARHRRDQFARRRRGAVSRAHRTISTSTWSPWRSAGSLTPGDDLRVVFGSQAAKTPGSRNIGGHRRSGRRRADREGSATPTAARGARRRLPRRSTACCGPGATGSRCGIGTMHWSPIGTCSRGPRRTPKYGTGAPDTWWWDAEKAKKTGMSG